MLVDSLLASLALWLTVCVVSFSKQMEDILGNGVNSDKRYY